MANVHFAIGDKPENLGLEDTKELLAIQGAAAIVAQCIESHIGVFLTEGAFDYAKTEEFIAFMKKAIVAESEQVGK